jgi:hypothetical protein
MKIISSMPVPEPIHVAGWMLMRVFFCVCFAPSIAVGQCMPWFVLGAAKCVVRIALYVYVL